jgi:hypothetical protein
MLEKFETRRAIQRRSRTERMRRAFIRAFASSR